MCNGSQLRIVIDNSCIRHATVADQMRQFFRPHPQGGASRHDRAELIHSPEGPLIMPVLLLVLEFNTVVAIREMNL